MKLTFSLLILFSFSAQAMPFMSVKERLRFHLWAYGIEQAEKVETKKPLKKDELQKREIPEELERVLRKI